MSLIENQEAKNQFSDLHQRLAGRIVRIERLLFINAPFEIIQKEQNLIKDAEDEIEKTFHQLDEQTLTDFVEAELIRITEEDKDYRLLQAILRGLKEDFNLTVTASFNDYLKHGGH